ncbi:MAG: DUF1801 domain-containing protein [Melioribacteraceae bacterium]|jgi:hypothetical protein|nr:DUF1801 domain-containing protein [Melioribacteraceae bacterium]
MAKVVIKTRKNNHSVEAFINTIENPKRREDSFVVLDLMKKITKEEPKIWGTSIVGFGNYHYKYSSGREGDWFVTGFSPRKASLSLYIMSGFKEYEELLSKLGKFKTGVSCLYINKLEDVDMTVLKKLIKLSVKKMKSNK